MDISSVIQLIILVILLALSAFFSSSETALTTVNRIRMRSLAEEGNKRAAKVLKITDDSAKMLSAILIGNNVVNLTASSLATTLAIHIFGNAGAGIATGILTVLIEAHHQIRPALRIRNDKEERSAVGSTADRTKDSHKIFLRKMLHNAAVPHKVILIGQIRQIQKIALNKLPLQAVFLKCLSGFFQRICAEIQQGHKIGRAHV